MDSNLIYRIVTDALWIIFGFVIGFSVTHIVISNKKYDKEWSEVDLAAKVIEQERAISWYRYALKVLADQGDEFAATSLSAGGKFYGK